MKPDDLTEAGKKQLEVSKIQNQYLIDRQIKEALILKQSCLKCACILFQGNRSTEGVIQEAKLMYKALQEEWN
jgi:hypothetical protein